MKIAKRTLKKDIQDISHTMKDLSKVNNKIDKLYEYINELEDISNSPSVAYEDGYQEATKENLKEQGILLDKLLLANKQHGEALDKILMLTKKIGE